MDEIKQKDPASLVYMDESGINDNETSDYAWGPKGQRVFDMKNAERSKRLSIISALINGKLTAPFVFEGMCDRPVFEVYIEKVLVPNLRPGQTVIMDNASFHKGGRIAQLIKAAGCYLLYLPSYSPDFNPIEHHWSGLKYRIKKQLPHCDHDLYKASENVFAKS